MSDKYICQSCTTNAHLKDWIQAHGIADQTCVVCGNEKTTAADVIQFAEYVDAVVRKNTSMVMPDPDYEEYGEDPKELIGRVAGIAEPVAKLVMKIGRSKDGGYPRPYALPLSFSSRWPDEHDSEWRRLRKIVKHEARFVGPETRAILDRLLGGIGTLFNGSAVRTLKPGENIYRARLERSRGEADQLFKSPQKELTAPPYHKATAARMNAAGIRVFYGALRVDICVAELRPPVGSHIVVGAFTPTRPLRVLDLGALGGIFDYVDLFSPEYDTLSPRLSFLHSLEDEISNPIQPHDEVLEYVPTQVIAEYVRHALRLDGIAYRSAQIGGAAQAPIIVDARREPDQRNIAFFGSAAVTEGEAAIPEGAQPGLRFVAHSAQMLDVTRIDIKYQLNMWAHYEDLPIDEEDEEDNPGA